MEVEEVFSEVAKDIFDGATERVLIAFVLFGIFLLILIHFYNNR